MGFFSRKPQILVSEFFADFYSQFVFAPQAEVYSRTVLKTVSQADSRFAQVDSENLHSELLAMWLEMIGLACSYRLKAAIAVAQSSFTRDYLSDSHRAELWEIMVPYNHAIAQSATHGLGKGRIAFINSFRMDTFDEYVKQGVDTEAATRVINRMFSDKCWKSGKTQLMLAMAMTRQLHFDGSEAVWARLAATAQGFYKGAVKAINEVSLAAD